MPTLALKIFTLTLITTSMSSHSQNSLRLPYDTSKNLSHLPSQMHLNQKVTLGTRSVLAPTTTSRLNVCVKKSSGWKVPVLKIATGQRKAINPSLFYLISRKNLTSGLSISWSRFPLRTKCCDRICSLDGYLFDKIT